MKGSSSQRVNPTMRTIKRISNEKDPLSQVRRRRQENIEVLFGTLHELPAT